MLALVKQLALKIKYLRSQLFACTITVLLNVVSCVVCILSFGKINTADNTDCAE